MSWRVPPGTLDRLYAKVAKAAGVTDGRDELARRTKIPGTNLSSINKGKRNMTDGYARRIAAAAGVSPLELGASPEPKDRMGRSVLARLQELEEGMNRLSSVLQRLERLEERLAALETPARPKTKRSGSPNGTTKR